MTISLKQKKQKPASDYASAIDAALRKQSDLEHERAAAQARIDHAQAELEQIRRAIAAREQERQALQARIDHAQARVSEQEEYCGLFAGKAGTDGLAERRAALRGLEEQYEAITDEHKDRIVSLEADIVQARFDLAQVTLQIANLGAARERLHADHGGVVYQECAALLAAKEKSLQAAKVAYEHEQAEMQVLRSAVLRRIEEWPARRRALEHEHALTDDATVAGLESYLQLLDTLIIHHRLIDHAPAGLPAGMVSILRELEQDVTFLNSLAAGDVSMASAKRERIASILQQYRRNLAKQ